MVTVLPEIVAVVAGRKSEYLTSGLAQPVKNTLKLKNKMVVKFFMRVVCLTIKMRHGGHKLLISESAAIPPLSPSNCSAAPGRGEHAGSRHKAESSRGESKAALWSSRLTGCCKTG